MLSQTSKSVCNALKSRSLLESKILPYKTRLVPAATANKLLSRCSPFWTRWWLSSSVLPPGPVPSPTSSAAESPVVHSFPEKLEGAVAMRFHALHPVHGRGVIIATHACTNGRFPLISALFLSTPQYYLLSRDECLFNASISGWAASGGFTCVISTWRLCRRRP